ncbi:hypothetical protein MNBD_CPR01-259, partial [hydrothermal vent metagenome]
MRFLNQIRIHDIVTMKAVMIAYRFPKRYVVFARDNSKPGTKGIGNTEIIISAEISTNHILNLTHACHARAFAKK